MKYGTISDEALASAIKHHSAEDIDIARMADELIALRASVDSAIRQRGEAEGRAVEWKHQAEKAKFREEFTVQALKDESNHLDVLKRLLERACLSLDTEGLEETANEIRNAAGSWKPEPGDPT